MLNFDRIADKIEKDQQRENKVQQRENNSGKQIQAVKKAVKKKSKSSFYVLLLGFAVLIVGGIVYHFWPAIKETAATTKTTVASRNGISLTGIFYSENDPDPIAMINGDIAHEGDIIKGVKVLKIHRDKVEFEKDGRKWSLSLTGVEETTGSNLPVLLELGSQKCPPCRRMTPILNELRDEYSRKFQIKYIDVWQDREAGAKYRVKAIPTQIFLDSKGREVFRHVGFYSKRDILMTWKNIGIKL
ncbi:MAG: thioredoxin fold domain-containing protein [Phycisphaerae bacterium]|nr:thioredoxin fold domain-containing protein [Phycisphaerae bacterium]NIP54388.1 thioredoxin fold domain-containing protein [Phycisphaerae bacterium]NIS53247.1 thioredoxin fold domain-containing protein [Phycisphaerae bacterium]NIU10773.1 thioredoxin fold domain-containing protein [Phycisphaerae bacterium]NIU58568.1 thioredoxin fold domain-containing protein [Phycisphaerae bacterium]